MSAILYFTCGPYVGRVLSARPRDDWTGFRVQLFVDRENFVFGPECVVCDNRDLLAFSGIRGTSAYCDCDAQWALICQKMPLVDLTQCERDVLIPDEFEKLTNPGMVEWDIGTPGDLENVHRDIRDMVVFLTTDTDTRACTMALLPPTFVEGKYRYDDGTRTLSV